jgi:hypothetical protein
MCACANTTTIYLGSASRQTSSGTPTSVGTALHRGKDFAVSPSLKRLVSVRTSRIAPCGRYPLPFCARLAPRPVFGLSSIYLAIHSGCLIRKKNYNTVSSKRKGRATYSFSFEILLKLYSAAIIGAFLSSVFACARPSTS